MIDVTRFEEQQTEQTSVLKIITRDEMCQSKEGRTRNMQFTFIESLRNECGKTTSEDVQNLKYIN